MIRLWIAGCLITIALHSSAYGQNLDDKCLATTTTGDAIIECLKASMLFERQQVQILRQLLQTLNRQTNLLLGRTVRNTAQMRADLDKIRVQLAKQGRSNRPHLFVNDLRSFSEAAFQCDDVDFCASTAQTVAQSLCNKLGFGSQIAHDFGLENGAGKLKWLVCRS